jgi:hypothetical protein
MHTVTTPADPKGPIRLPSDPRAKLTPDQLTLVLAAMGVAAKTSSGGHDGWCGVSTREGTANAFCPLPGSMRWQFHYPEADGREVVQGGYDAKRQ